MTFTGMFAKMKGKGERDAKANPKPTGDSDYDQVERLDQIFDEQTDDLQGFPEILK
jgi:hypothetical protein